MTIEVKTPELPESVADGTLLEWRVSVGQSVRRDDNLVEIETDKVVLEIPAPESGTIRKILKPNGENVTSGDVLAVLEESTAIAPAPESQTAQQQGIAETAAMPMSPAVKKLIADNNLDPHQISGSGKAGRIIKQDVLAYLAGASGPESASGNNSGPPHPQAGSMPAIPQPEDLADDGRMEKRVPMTRLRTRIAERLVQSQQTTATLTTFNEIDMQPILSLREKYQEQFIRKHDVKLGFMSFFVKACTEALKYYPVLNASVDGSDIIYHGFYDIGIAVGSPRGLVVPILRNTDTLSFGEIEKTIRDFSARAQDGKLALDELDGGTFSITNGGIFGSMLSTPVINPPQSAILGMHNILQRAVVEQGEIVARPMMYLALSYDHRIIDGREAIRFLVKIKQSLENPATMLLAL